MTAIEILAVRKMHFRMRLLERFGDLATTIIMESRVPFVFPRMDYARMVLTMFVLY